MNFLSPWWVPVIAGGLTIPPLVLLYFLKFKRRDVPIPSTLLWRRAVQDLQVNSPFQKLKNNLLLILQILILLAAILAISEPMWAGTKGNGRLHVFLIDCSASMAAKETTGDTRLELAKEEAHRLIDQMAPADRAMVIPFADRARVFCAITDDKARLHNAVKEIVQTDAPGRLAPAMALAEAPSSAVGEKQGDENPINAARYLLFSDGRLADTDSVRVQRGSLEIIRVGQSSENVAIVNLDVRRNYEQPEQVSILTRVRNFGGEKITRDVSLLVDGDIKAVHSVELTPLGERAKLGRMTLTGIPAEQSEASVPFEMVLPTAAQIEVRISGQDPFATDDHAYAVVAPPRPLTVLLVTEGNRFLRQLLASLPIEHSEIWSPEKYEDAPDEELIQNGRCKFDLVILDGHSTGRLPPGNYLCFACVPTIEKVEIGETVKGQAFLDWDDTHPILRHVAVEAMNVFSWMDIKLPQDAITLIEGTSGPVMSLLRRERNQYLICAFGLFDETRTYPNTDWFFQEGFVVFGYNALRYLTGSSSSGQVAPVAPGEAFSAAVKPGVKSASVRRPDGKIEDVLVDTSGVVTYGRTDRVGIYTISPGAAGDEARAVNLVNSEESFIAPNEDFRVAAGQVAESKTASMMEQPLWPFALALLGVILFVEWFVYCRRVLVQRCTRKSNWSSVSSRVAVPID